MMFSVELKDPECRYNTQSKQYLLPRDSVDTAAAAALLGILWVFCGTRARIAMHPEGGNGVPHVSGIGVQRPRG